jgi:hypothetical protein
MAAASLCKNGATASSVAPFRFAPPWWPPARTQTFERVPNFPDRRVVGRRSPAPAIRSRRGANSILELK